MSDSISEDNISEIISKVPGGGVERQRQPLMVPGLIIPLIITSIAIAATAYIYRDNLSANLKFIYTLGQARVTITYLSLFILPFLTFTYLVAWNLKKDNFFFFAALYWIHNLIYLLFADSWLQKKPEDPNNPEFLQLQLFQALLSLTADFYLYIAAATNNEKLTVRKIIIPSSFFLLWLVVYFYPNDNWQLRAKVDFLFVTGSIIAAGVIFAAGWTIYSKFKKTNHLKLLSLTFFAYAGLQLFFLPIPYEVVGIDSRKFTNFTFWVSFTLKVVNGYALVMLLRNYYSYAQNSWDEAGKAIIEKMIMAKNVIAESNKAIEYNRTEIASNRKIISDQKVTISGQNDEITKQSNEISHITDRLGFLLRENEKKKKELKQKNDALKELELKFEKVVREFEENEHKIALQERDISKQAATIDKQAADINKQVVVNAQLRVQMRLLREENQKREEELNEKNKKVIENEKVIYQQEKEIDRQQAEKRLIEAKLKALAIENENKSKELMKKSEFEDIGVLTASIEHELRQPLHNVYSISAILKLENQTELTKLGERLGNAHRSMLAAVDIVNTLREQGANIQEEMDPIEFYPFINTIVDKMKKEFRTKEEFKDHQKKQIYFDFETNKDRLFVKGFPFLLEKVFINFLRNSIESGFTDRDSVKISIKLEVTDEHKDKIFISITDNGTGFLDKNGNKMEDSKIRETVIKAGYTTKEIYGMETNRGIGLFVCDRILNIHKAKMEFFNIERRGAKIIVIMDRYFSRKQRKKQGGEN